MTSAAAILVRRERCVAYFARCFGDKVTLRDADKKSLSAPKNEMNRRVVASEGCAAAMIFRTKAHLHQQAQRQQDVDLGEFLHHERGEALVDVEHRWPEGDSQIDIRVVDEVVDWC